jgi:hypothetical protein
MRSIAPNPFSIKRSMEAVEISRRQHDAGAKSQFLAQRFKAASENVTDAEHAQIPFPGKAQARNIALMLTSMKQGVPSAWHQ